MGHEVWVLTTSSGRENIEYARAEFASAQVGSIHVIYHDPPFPPKRMRHSLPGFYLYYFAWQFFALWPAKSLNKEVKFDFVQHITYGAHRYPSFMVFLGVPFIFGPVGGGERAPYRLRRGLRAWPWLCDFARDLSNLAAFCSPVLHLICKNASLIACKTQETVEALPRSAHSKCCVAIEIGAAEVSSAPEPRYEREFRVAYIGRLHYVKGLHLAIRAFALAAKSVPNARFTIIGAGPEEAALRKLAHMLEINESIDWIPWMERSEVLRKYATHDVLLFPSLHDSSGNVVLEALSNAVPVVCLDLGGPAQLVNESCGRVVATKGMSEESVCNELARSLVEIGSDRVLHARLRQGALVRARDFNLPETIRRIYAMASAQVARSGA
jgi:glycosyltransferase involved in cell wall biosynthesis